MKLLDLQVVMNKALQEWKEETQARAEKEEEEFGQTIGPSLRQLYQRACTLLAAVGELQRVQIGQGFGHGIIGYRLNQGVRLATPQITIEIEGFQFHLFLQTPVQEVGFELNLSAQNAVDHGYAGKIALGAAGLERALILSDNWRICQVVAVQIDDAIFPLKGVRPTLEDVIEFRELLGFIEKSFAEQTQ